MERGIKYKLVVHLDDQLSTIANQQRVVTALRQAVAGLSASQDTVSMQWRALAKGESLSLFVDQEYIGYITLQST